MTRRTGWSFVNVRLSMNRLLGALFLSFPSAMWVGCHASETWIMSKRTLSDSSATASGSFPHTHWSVIWAARDGDSTEAAEALNKLCRAYWRPLFCYARRRGYDFEQARDLTQGFFARLLEKEQLRHVTHQEGKFRSFLLTLMNHFLGDERDKAQALKRGGGQSPVFLDALSEEERYQVEPAHGASPEQLFDRRWAQTVLEKAAERLREEYEAAGKGALFETLQSLPHGRSGVGSTYADLAARLAMSESAITSAIHRLRRRHAELLREEVAETVADGSEVDGEIRYLMEVIGR